MSRARHIAPSLADFAALAAQARDRLPEVFRSRCEGLVVRIADFAEPDVLESLGISDPFGLTGLYHGVALPDRSVSDPPMLGPMVWLYRRAILDEWAARGDVALDRLIEHVLVHEIAHHFGLTDEQIAAIDDWRL